VLRLIRWSATGLVVLAAAAWAVVWAAQANPGSRAAALVQLVSEHLDAPPGSAALAGIGGPFSLVNAQGQPVTDATYRGRWMLVYFGYAYCPDICPTTLQTISTVLDELGAKAAKIAPLFITVDPARDTPAAIGQYVGLFDSRLIGLTGTAEQVANAETAYHVYSRRAGDRGANDYTIDHSSFVYLMGPDGKLKLLFPAETNEADMVEKITASMSGQR
jgi:cytochrome oxidase Cu insertion factor (SCO1/SenC/PrrC family)